MKTVVVSHRITQAYDRSFRLIEDAKRGQIRWILTGIGLIAPDSELRGRSEKNVYDEKTP